MSKTALMMKSCFVAIPCLCQREDTEIRNDVDILRIGQTFSKLSSVYFQVASAFLAFRCFEQVNRDGSWWFPAIRPITRERYDSPLHCICR